jgi:hypothetical protein
MDLPTHAIFGFAIGLVFFGHPEIALLHACMHFLAENLTEAIKKRLSEKHN